MRALARATQRLGVSVDVLCLRDEHTAEDLSAWAPLTPEAFPFRGPASFGWSPALMARLRAILAEEPATAISVHGLWMWPGVAGRLAGAQRVVHPHGMVDPWALGHRAPRKRIAWALYERANLAGAAAIRALNESEAAAARAILPGARVVVIPNGVDLNVREAVVRDARPEKILFLGRLHPKKGLRELVEAWTLLERPRPKLIIAGPDQAGFEAELRRLAARWGLEGDVSFTGEVLGEAKAALLASCDGFILPSHSEGMSMAVLEAAAAGLPVLLTRSANADALFDAGGAVDLGATPDPALIAAALSRFISSPPAERRELAACASAHVRRHHEWDAIARRFLEECFPG